MDAQASTPVAIERQRASRRGVGWTWLLGRLAMALAVLFAISLLVFGATVALPGDPARVILGSGATAESIAALNERLGLDNALSTQYLDWLSGVLSGDFGNSLVNEQSVREVIGPRLANSASLVLMVAIVVLPLALVLGALSALRRDGPLDKTVLLLALGLAALPEFVVGIVLVLLFATNVFSLLPAVAYLEPGQSPFLHPTKMILPVATLAIAVFPYLYRLVRGSTIDALESEYVHMARLKGMPERLVLFRHALPNALVPAVQGTALALAYLTGGIVIVEFLFGYPGMGSLLVGSVSGRDVPVIQATVLIFATAYLAFNMLADFVTILLTPRLRDSR
jgi:peptide/nickel transport system permease protein